MNTLFASLFIVALITLVSATPTPTPIFAWSSSSTQLQGQNFELESQSVSSILKDTSNKFENKPELIVVFVSENVPEISDSTFPSLHKILKQSPSSLTVPYVYGENVRTSVQDFGASVDGQFFASGKKNAIKGAKHVLFKNLKATLKKNNAFENNKVDVVAIALKEGRSDATIEKVSEFLNSANKDYVCIFAMEQSDAQIQMEFPRDNLSRVTRSVNKKKHEEAETPGEFTTRWTADVIQIIAFMAIFIFTVVLGTIATMNIQVPTKFEGGITNKQ